MLLPLQDMLADKYGIMEVKVATKSNCLCSPNQQNADYTFQ